MADDRTDASMPDVVMRELAEPRSPLDWVGMHDLPLPIEFSDGEAVRTAHAKTSVFVDLVDEYSKGIHMSRLYVVLNEHAASSLFSPAQMCELVDDLLGSQDGLSSKALVEFSFDHFIRRDALVSDNSGWNTYPILLRGKLDEGVYSIDLKFSAYYSSTCPCSAALSRQLIQEQFDTDFKDSATIDREVLHDWLGSERGIVATPHGQRSVADISVRLNSQLPSFPLTSLVDSVERALATPVQTAVKREDEREFALLNGQNAMFCEDASRKLKDCLEMESSLLDYRIRVEHQESLHAHNAVSVVTKGVKGGFQSHP